MPIYFDNAATTKVDDLVIKSYIDLNNELYANPSAMHRMGYLAEQQVKSATSTMAEILSCESAEIVWTSGGTESNNLAIKGVADSYKRIGKHIITTTIEHAAVKNVYSYLEENGYEVTYLPVDKTGHISLDDLKNNIRKDTILISIMYVNNEIGSVQNIDLIGNTIKSINNNTIFHTDFVQGFGKFRVDVKKSKIDLLSISSHKFNGPKGVGILYKKKDIRISAQILGGGQQGNLRSGTLNVPGIVGTAVAAKIYYDNFDDVRGKLFELRNYLITSLLELNKKYNIITINTELNDDFAPHIVSVSFKGIRAEVMLHKLEDYDIFISAGSACSSHNKKTSNTLINIGLSKELAEGTIRISFGRFNNKNEIDVFIKTLDEIIPILSLKRK